MFDYAEHRTSSKKVHTIIYITAKHLITMSFLGFLRSRCTSEYVKIMSGFNRFRSFYLALIKATTCLLLDRICLLLQKVSESSNILKYVCTKVKLIKPDISIYEYYQYEYEY